jgi:glycolate oxidase FAD binding subunit
MSKSWKPENIQQLLDAVKWAVAKGESFNVQGRGSKQGFGRPVQAGQDLDVGGLRGITAYEPHELFMTANAATPIAEIKAALSQHKQQLAFEPPDMGVLYGSKEGSGEDGSIGGAIACNLAGPRRIQAGAARDHFLGFNAVSGRGEVFKSGGTVIKNVTGFDLSKLLAGSFGTLAVMNRVTFKVMPAAEKVRTVLCLGLDDSQAVKILAMALGSSNEVSAAAHLPVSAASRSGVNYVSGVGAAVTVIRVEGPGMSVEHRCKALRELLSNFGVTDELHSQNSYVLWKEIGNVGALLGDGQVWRLSVPPMDGVGVVKTILDATEAQVFYDWGGGLVWLALETSDVCDEIVRGAVEPTGGHATLVRAASSVRKIVPVFKPLSHALNELTVRVKRAFDPKGALNPGRLYEGL